MKRHKHGCLIGSSTPNAPIKNPEAQSPFSVFFYVLKHLLLVEEARGLVWFVWRRGGGLM